MSRKPEHELTKSAASARKRIDSLQAAAAAAGIAVTPLRPRAGRPGKTASGEIQKREWNAEHEAEIKAGKLVAFPVDELFIAAAQRAAAAALLRPPKALQPAPRPPETEEEAERNARERLRDGGGLDQRMPKSPFSASNWRGGGWRGGGIL